MRGPGRGARRRSGEQVREALDPSWEARWDGGEGAASRRIEEGGRRGAGGEACHEAKSSLVADGTEGEVDSDEAAKGVEGGFAGRRRSRRRSDREQGSAARQATGALPIRAAPEVSDAREAWGQDLEQEAPEQLGSGEVHRLGAVAVRVVAPAEVDHAVVHGQDAVRQTSIACSTRR